MPILFDFESRSEADLEAIGGRNYWAHPTTEALCAVLYDTDADVWAVWEPGDPAPWDASDTVVAHNYDTFDRFGAEKYGWPTPRVAIDSSVLARRAGIPGALDALAKRWLGREKDHAGNKVVMCLSGSPVAGDTVDKKTGRIKRGVPEELRELLREYNRERKRAGKFPPIPPEVMARVRGYNRDDVDVMRVGWPRLFEWNDVDADAYAVDRLINDRGVRFDVQLAQRLVAEIDYNIDRELDEIARALKRSPAEVHAIANSPAQFTEFTGLPNAQAETVARFVHDGGGDVGLMCRARQAIASIARGKLEAGLARVSADGRLRDSLRYYGAHTGRWSHTGMQLGNMPRPADRFEKWTDEDVCRLADSVLSGGHCTKDEVDVLVRACLYAADGNTLIVEDFSGVEARGLAWAAEDWPALQVFEDPSRNPYFESASMIYGVPASSVKKGTEQYSIGKIAELACGYQGGKNALLNMAANYGVDLSKASKSPQEIVDG